MKRMQNVVAAVDLEARFRVMDEFGDYCQVLSLPAPPLRSPGWSRQVAVACEGRQRWIGRTRGKAPKAIHRVCRIPSLK